MRNARCIDRPGCSAPRLTSRVLDLYSIHDTEGAAAGQSVPRHACVPHMTNRPSPNDYLFLLTMLPSERAAAEFCQALESRGLAHPLNLRISHGTRQSHTLVSACPACGAPCRACGAPSPRASRTACRAAADARPRSSRSLSRGGSSRAGRRARRLVCPQVHRGLCAPTSSYASHMWMNDTINVKHVSWAFEFLVVTKVLLER